MCDVSGSGKISLRTRFLITMTTRKLAVNSKSNKAMQTVVCLREEAPGEFIEEFLVRLKDEKNKKFYSPEEVF